MADAHAADNQPVTEKLMVALRIRPLTQEEVNKGVSTVAHKLDDTTIVLSDPHCDDGDVLRQNRIQSREYVFDCAFNHENTQEAIYLKTTKALVDNVMNGFNATVFAYGATGSGKTYTMVGTGWEKGIMVRALNDLFARMAALPAEQTAAVTMAYMEIYNETIRDLLKPESGVLELREDSKNGIQVAGLSEVSTISTEEVMELLMKGNKARTVEPTAANKTSSRSHALLQVNVHLRNHLQPTGSASQRVRMGRIYMIDLAGSERASQTQNRGKRLVEGAHINRSLLALGNCINALSEKGAKYVNFRDSKLTRLLKDALTGNCRTVMIAHISPASPHYEESRNTLAYADRAKRIRNKIKRNVMDVTYHVAQYQGIIDDLRKEISRLKTMIQRESSSPDIESEPRVKVDEEYVKNLRESLVTAFKEQMSHRHRLLEIDSQALSLSMEFEKNSLIISEWEVERAKLGKSNESKLVKDKAEKETAKEWESEEDEDITEPDHVQQAWDELLFIQSEQQRYLEERNEVLRHLVEWRATTEKLIEKKVPRINGGDQRELLVLLCKVYELEIEKTEMQAGSLLKEHELRRKDLMILRYDRQRNLSDEIITRQRMLIDDNRVPCPQDLMDLYRQYQQEIEEMVHGRENFSRAVSTWTSLTSAKSNRLTKDGLESRLSREKLPPLSNNREEKMFVRLRRPPSQSSTSESLGKRTGSVISIRSTFSSVPSTPMTSEMLSLPPLTVPDIERVQLRQNVQGINAIAARRKQLGSLEAVKESDERHKTNANKAVLRRSSSKSQESSLIRHARSDDNILSYSVNDESNKNRKRNQLPSVLKNKEPLLPENSTNGPRRRSLFDRNSRKNNSGGNATSAPTSPLGSSDVTTTKTNKPDSYQLPQHNMIFRL